MCTLSVIWVPVSLLRICQYQNGVLPMATTFLFLTKKTRCYSNLSLHLGTSLLTTQIIIHAKLESWKLLYCSQLFHHHQHHHQHHHHQRDQYCKSLHETQHCPRERTSTSFVSSLVVRCLTLPGSTTTNPSIPMEGDKWWSKVFTMRKQH